MPGTAWRGRSAAARAGSGRGRATPCREGYRSATPVNTQLDTQFFISGRGMARAYNRASFFGSPHAFPSMNIGPHELANNLFVAPMAGVTDRPFRMLCRTLGAGYAVSEMVTSRRDLWATLKTSRRANHDGEPGPIAVQIAGTDALMMAEAAA